MNKPKPDDRSNNVERLQQMVENTTENIEEAQKTMQNEDMSQDEKAAIQAKNERREQSIQGFQAEIKDEQAARERGEY